MPMAVPLIGAGISAFSSWRQRKAQQKAGAVGGPASLEGPATALAAQQGQQGQGLFNFGMPQLQRAAGYYGNLLSGSRSAIASTIAPDVAALSDTYRGAARNLERAPPGAGRDVAAADLNRQRAGQIGGLAMAVRPNAAAQVAGMGQFGVGQGTSATASAGGMYSSLLGHNLNERQFGFDQQKYKDQQSMEFGKNLSKILTDFIGAYRGRQKANAGGTSTEDNWG